VLYVRGGGDPFLITEELTLLARGLVAAIGKQPLRGIVLDASYYPADLRIPGIEDTEEAYYALNSALAVSLLYAGELIAAFIERPGDSVEGEIATGSAPTGLEPVYVRRQSRTLSKILLELLRASNNYIADQVFLEMVGTASMFGQPREITTGHPRDARDARPRRTRSSRGRGHQPRQPLHGSRARKGARAFCAPRRPAPRP
jgi:D-alanyl-D-alanine carboxypeptidase